MIVAAACSVEGEAQTADVPAETASAPAALIWILALGDSYTVGERVGKLENWPAQLVRKLRIQGRAAAEPKVIAATSRDTFDLTAAIVAADLEGPFDVVTLLIGFADQHGNRVRGWRCRSGAAHFDSRLEGDPVRRSRAARRDYRGDRHVQQRSPRPGR